MTGAGTAAANGVYTSVDAGITYINAGGYIIFEAGANWLLVNILAQTVYLIPLADFPCGTWTLGAAGAAPVPTVEYT